MKQSIIYALDFDGVICDSAVETAITAWKAGTTLWDDFAQPLPPNELIQQFRQLRPYLETGYEAILIMRLLQQGESVATLALHYAEKLEQLMQQDNLTITGLKKLFGETRDHWIDTDLADWIAMNPLFAGIAEKLQHLNEQGAWYIITTKQERFVKQILQANGIQLADANIFGLDRNLSKEAVLIDLIKKHPQQTIYFVEDRLPTLFKVMGNEVLSSVALFFALWGYNTNVDFIKATTKKTINVITLDQFLN